MSELVIRKLLIDLAEPMPRHWNGGDAFSSALLNALSMSFPVGEQFFIDSVRAGHKALPEAEQARFSREVQGFIGQEATHRRLHGLFNDQLTRLGYVNHWEVRARARLKRMERLNCRHAVAATAATEHLTAILAEWLLSRPQMLAGAPARLRTLWHWHASEESEHRCTAFDLYKALGGDETRRLRWMRLVTLFFLMDLLRQTSHNLWRDGELMRWRTWKSGWRFLFGAGGLISSNLKPWRTYFNGDFHPAQQDDQLSRDWLSAHASDFTVVSRP